ncbi:hypothetical protein GCM10010289_05470 [Streptomyces violascens]|uniref:Uncharacterized protein n=1 Tax=Streptomyces violascens TaxID=67381 RepID=A0ABQ3QG17_9ACTN|nr:hypothetical protein GCM10010289_05470 [Streptomyces violascens]GHI36213.1 hypothetical protein Sviol_06210 [Streptomyces violascens]
MGPRLSFWPRVREFAVPPPMIETATARRSVGGWAQGAFHPPQPWRELLGAAVCSAVSGAGAGEDCTYGSALLDVAAISRTVGGRRDLVGVLSCGAAVHIVHPLCRGEGMPLVGGGTGLREGFARALRAQPRPDARSAFVSGGRGRGGRRAGGPGAPRARRIRR